MSKYRSFPLISWKKRASKVKQVTKQPKTNTEADQVSRATSSRLAFGLGHSFVPISYDFYLLR